jgi:hypothetical protein
MVGKILKYEDITMNNQLYSTDSLTDSAIDALENAYLKSTNIHAKISIAIAYSAISRLKSACGSSGSCDNLFDIDGDYDPSEYCAAI